jgi:excisionase family DNA binding protein
MDDFLTTRQTQDMLKVDRITIYRMLNDGRLKGTKIGQQWRFPRQEVERLLNGAGDSEPAVGSSLPVHCLQTIQDLFSTVSQFSAALINPQGELITTISHPCTFCQLYTDSPAVMEACRASRLRFLQQAENGEKRFTCHAGLHYAGRFVHLGGQAAALFIVGGYRQQTADSGTEINRQAFINEGITESDLNRAYEEAPVLPFEQESKLDTWAEAAAGAFESILQERSAFSHRLKKIADLTQIP